LRQFKVGVRHRICFVLRTPKRTPTFNTGQYGELRRHLDSTQTSVGYGVPYAEPRSIVDVGRVLKAAVIRTPPDDSFTTSIHCPPFHGRSFVLHKPFICGHLAPMLMLDLLQLVCQIVVYDFSFKLLVLLLV
jgi:hypothetical protein